MKKQPIEGYPEVKLFFGHAGSLYVYTRISVFFFRIKSISNARWMERFMQYYWPTPKAGQSPLSCLLKTFCVYS